MVKYRAAIKQAPEMNYIVKHFQNISNQTIPHASTCSLPVSPMVMLTVSNNHSYQAIVCQPAVKEDPKMN